MVEEMVGMAMVVAPRGLVCGSTISAAAVECHRLAMARVWGARMPILLKPGGSRVPVPSPPSLSASRRGYLCHTGLSRGTKLSTRMPVQETWRGHREKSYAGAAAVEELPETTKKRLTREERAAVVESFVRKHMAENQGEFPSLTLVLKETGGSRVIVKDILVELQTSLTSKVEETAALKDVAPASKSNLDESVEGEVAEALSTSGASSGVSDSEDEEEDDSEQESAESKPVEKITTLRRMVGETPGEINTYSDILSRLRSLGKKEDSPEKLPPEVRNEFAAETDERATSEAQRKPSFAARILPPRHGMFVRFLHPSATEEDLRNAFGDCGEITRVSAVKPMKPTAKFTYGFIDFKTADGLSNALRKSVEIRGHKVETEAAPTQNTGAAIPDAAVPKAKDSQGGGTTMIDNLVSKVVSMVPENGSPMKNLGKTATPSWNGQDGRFSKGGGMLQNKGTGPDFKGSATDFSSKFRTPREGLFQRNEMPPRNEMPQRFELPQRNEMPPQRNETPYRNEYLPPRNDNGVMPSPIPPLSDPQKLRRNLAICVENIPANMNVSHVKEALSVHGEVVATYIKHREMAGGSYYFEYLTEDAKDSALTAHWLYVNGQQLRLTRADAPKTTVVRVSNISPSTPDSEFINACKSCGVVERVESRRDRVRDVFFHGSEMRNMARILDRMNEITINQSRWHAKPAPRCSPGVLGSPDGQEWLCQQMKILLKNQENMLQQLQIEHRDLRELTMYVVEVLGSGAQTRRP